MNLMSWFEEKWLLYFGEEVISTTAPPADT